MGDMMSDFDIQLRKSSNVDKNRFPYLSKHCPLIVIDLDLKVIRQASSKSEKEKEVLEHGGGNVIFLQPWPGEWSQDVFVVDRQELITALLNV